MELKILFDMSETTFALVAVYCSSTSSAVQTDSMYSERRVASSLMGQLLCYRQEGVNLCE